MAHLDALVAALGPSLRARPIADWLTRLEAVGVPSGPVLSIGEMHRDPQTLARQMVTEVPHTTLGPVHTLGLPVKLSATPGGPRRGAPILGEHTRAVLAEHGYSQSEIDRLIAEGVVVAAEEARDQGAAVSPVRGKASR